MTSSFQSLKAAAEAIGSALLVTLDLPLPWEADEAPFVEALSASSSKSVSITCHRGGAHDRLARRLLADAAAWLLVAEAVAGPRFLCGPTTAPSSSASFVHRDQGRACVNLALQMIVLSLRRAHASKLGSSSVVTGSST